MMKIYLNSLTDIGLLVDYVLDVIRRWSGNDSVGSVINN
jgi:hypothetical protein